MEDFIRKRLTGLPLLILVRKAPGLFASIQGCMQGREGQSCRVLQQHVAALLASWLIVVLGYFAVLPFEGLFQPVYTLVSQKTDAFLSLSAGTDAGDEQQGIPPVELYDIDEATYRGWQSPAIVPRDKLAFLIKRAVDGGAAVIAVDVSLTYPDMPDKDRKLGELLKSLNESDDPDAPVVILTRKLQRPLDAGKRVDHGTVFALPASFLDAYLPVQKRVFWSSTLFNIDDDHLIRRWRNAEVYCSPGGGFALLPSLQLMAAVAYGHKWRGDDPAEALQRVEQRLSGAAAGRHCDGTEAIPSLKAYYAKYPANGDVIQLDYGDHSKVLNLADFGEAERINYRIAPVRDAHTKSQLVVTSAADLEFEPAKLDVLDRLVLIGATFEESNDLHSTPIASAPLPGIYILANAIDTLQGMGQRNASTLMLGPAISLLMLVIGALLLERGLKLVWLGCSLLAFFLVGVFAYTPGGSAAALPFSVFLVVLWYVMLQSLDKFVRKKHEHD